MSETASSYIHVSSGNSSNTLDDELDSSPRSISVMRSDLAPAEPTSSALRYVYYLIYTEDGARRSEQPVDPDNPYLARIWAKQVTPPHTVASLKRCICNFEGIPQAFIRGQLFSDISSESPMDDGRISILTSDGPGFNPEQPMSLIVPAIDLTLVYNVMVSVTWNPQNGHAGQTATDFEDPYPSSYLPITEGEILYTDCKLRMEKRTASDLCYSQKVFLVLNAEGNLGFVHTDKLKQKPKQTLNDFPGRSPPLRI